MRADALQIEPFKEEGKLPGRHLHDLLPALRPMETVLLKSFLVKSESISIPEEDLQSRTPPVAKDKQVPREGIEGQLISFLMSVAPRAK